MLPDGNYSIHRFEIDRLWISASRDLCSKIGIEPMPLGPVGVLGQVVQSFGIHRQTQAGNPEDDGGPLSISRKMDAGIVPLTRLGCLE
jgi:hypothetical protein